MADFKEVMLTTVDNPYCPFTQWDQWYRYDEKSGYMTCERLALLSRNSNELSEAETDERIDAAIQTLLHWYDPYPVYTIAIKGKTQRFGI